MTHAAPSQTPEQRVKEATRALEARYRGVPEDAVIVVNTYENSSFRTHTYTRKQLHRLAEDWAGKEFDVWTRISVLPPNLTLQAGSRGLETQTWGTSMLWVDLDPDGTETWRSDKLQELRQFTPKPTRIEDSGRGLYAFWEIPWTEDWQHAKRANKWLAESLNGDHCWDMARVLRLPGTLNPKEGAGWCRVVEANVTSHTLKDFGQASLTSLEERVQDQELEPVPLPFDFEHRLQVTSSKLWDRIRDEDSALAAGAQLTEDRSRVDRSRNDFFIASQLLRVGIEQGVVYSVLTHPTWFSGEKWRQSGFNESYVRTTIQKASQLASVEELTNTVIIGDRLRETYELIYLRGEWWIYEEDRGVYQRADKQVQLAVQALMGPKWKYATEEEVWKYLNPHCTIKQDDVPKQNHLINVRNGMLNWKTGHLEPHHSKWRSTNQIYAKWDPEVDTQAVDDFISAVLPKDAIQVWWMFCGYCLYTDVPMPFRALFALIGPKRTGKSTLLRGLRRFLGNDNVSSVSLDQLTGNGNQFTLGSMLNRMVNIDEDAEHNRPMKEQSLLKKLADGGVVSIERKNVRDVLSLELFCKMAFAMNDFPLAPGADAAFYDRWIILEVRSDHAPFTAKNPDRKVNAEVQLLADDANRDAWLLRSAQGLKELVALGEFPETAALQAAKLEFELQSDPILTYWLRYTSAVVPADQRPQPLSVFYKHYANLTKEQGAYPMSQRQFIARTRDIEQDTRHGEKQGVPGMKTVQKDTWHVVGRTPKRAEGASAEIVDGKVRLHNLQEA